MRSATFLGAGPLGYFQNAFTIYSNVLSILTEPVHNIAASSLSKLRNNIDELKRSWKMALSLLSFFSAPAFAILAVTGQDFVVLLLGQKWAPAGPLLCIFRRPRHRPQHRAHHGLDARGRRSRRPLDVVGRLQRRVPANLLASVHADKGTPHPE